jgi:CrcB protein
MSALGLYLVFGMGGGLGAVFRHLITKLITHRFPLSTLLVNVLGCFILGLGVGLLDGSNSQMTEEERKLIFGFCGGFTTFSSFAYQSLGLHRNETTIHAAANILASLVLCLISFAIGIAMT